MKPSLPGTKSKNRDRVPVDGPMQTAPMSHPVFVDSMSSPDLSTSPGEKPRPGVRAAIVSIWLWRTRGFWLGGVGVGLALFGQEVLTVDHNVTNSIRWYALGIVMVLLAWLGTYKNKSLLVVPVRRVVNTMPVRQGRSAGRSQNSVAQRGLSVRWRQLVRRYPLVAGTWSRYLLAFAAFDLNIYSATLIRNDYYSAVGGFGWLASLALLVVAFLHERRAPVRELDADIVEVEDRTDPRPSRLVEATIVACVFALAIFLRFYRLGDWSTGVHGDEGEAGLDALNILEGNHVSPFTTGWFSQPNFYYWGIAIGMKLFGTGLFGDRIFSTVMGTLMLVPFYPLVRMWFGVRTAIIATIFLAISDVTIHFTRIELSNITTPLSLVLGFYFFYRGMCDKQALNFVLSAFGFMFGLYFYNGGRLTPLMLIGVLLYLFFFMPLVRVPASYRHLRKLSPGLSRARVLLGAARTQTLYVLHYFPQIVIFLVACICFASPFLVYLADHSQELNARAGEKLIFNNEARMQAQYAVSHQVSHAPLYIGIRWPTQSDLYPVIPVFFERTPMSVKVQDDGFWTRVLWGQTTTTLSIMTYRAEACSFYTFTQEPVAKPIEAALIIIGLSWALWRWRDTRMAMLSLWFWSTIFAGGVLTIDAPYMCRIIGIVPTLAIFAALPLSKLSAEAIGVFGRLGRKAVRQRVWKRVGQTISATSVVTLLVYLTLQNYSDYFLRYLATYPFNGVTGHAQFVLDMNAHVTSEGRPQPVYYDLGMHLIYWGHGTNRFLNHGTDGHDMANPADELPVLNNNQHDVVFMVWDLNSHYLQAIKTYYPEGEEGTFMFGPSGADSFLFKYYRVKKEQIDARRVSLATYTPDVGPAIERQEPGIGSAGPPPPGLTYPARAEWHGDVVAPTFGLYRFSLDTEGGGTLLIDDAPVLTNTMQVAHSEGELLLARGPHDVRVAGTLANPDAQVVFKWSSGGSSSSAVARQYLWSGPGRGLLGVVRPYTGDLSSGSPSDTTEGSPASPAIPNVISERIDGFLGFRDSPSALGGDPLYSTWTSTLTITQTGQYGFDVYSNGSSTVFIDGQQVLKSAATGGQPTQGSGQVHLTAGPHKYELRYIWQEGTGYLEAFWIPLGGERALLGPEALHMDGGIVDPGAVASEPPSVDLNQPDGGDSGLP